MSQFLDHCLRLPFYSPQKLFDASYTFYIVTLLYVILLDIAAYLTMYYFGTGWIPFLVSLACISTCQVRVIVLYYML